MFKNTFYTKEVSKNYKYRDIFAGAYKVLFQNELIDKFINKNKGGILIIPGGSSLIGSRLEQFVIEEALYCIKGFEKREQIIKSLFTYIGQVYIGQQSASNKMFRDKNEYVVGCFHSKNIGYNNLVYSHKITESQERIKFSKKIIELVKDLEIKNDTFYLESDDYKNIIAEQKSQELKKSLSDFFGNSEINYAYYFYPQPYLNECKEYFGNIVVCTNKELTEELIYKLQEFTYVVLSTVRLVYQLKLEQAFLETQLRNAINAILIDSYSHNISAHSLNYLQGLFGRRTEEFLKKNHHLSADFIRMQGLALNELSYEDFFRGNLDNRAYKRNDEGEIIKDGDGKGILTDNLNYQVAIGKDDSTNTIHYGNILDYIKYSEDSPNVNALRYKYPNQGNKIPFPLDCAIAPLMRYLRNKGVLWGGVLKDNVATPNRIMNLYDSLMEFCENPLFIGSIVASEEIFIIHIHTHICDNYGTAIEKSEKCDYDYNKNETHFLTINLRDFIEEEFGVCLSKECELKKEINNLEEYLKTTEDKSKEKDLNEKKVELEGIEKNKLKFIPKHHSPLSFVRLSKYHKKLREGLKDISIMFPGGDVGKQAFYTIIENTLRNAKHINNDHFKEIKENGLELHFHFNKSKSKLNKKNEIVEPDKEDLLQVTMRLDYKGYNIHKNFTEVPHQVKQSLFNSIRNSYSEVLTDKGEPKLGGSSQDKVCATALLYKQFTKVQKKDGVLKEYFPWMKFAVHTNNVDFDKIYGKDKESNFIKGLKNGRVNLDKICSLFEEKQILPDYKYSFVKQFYLWQGEDVMDCGEIVVSDDKQDVLPARFKIGIYEEEENNIEELQKSGVVRLIEYAGSDFAKAYKEWNKKWLIDNPIPIIGVQGQEKDLKGGIKTGNKNADIIIKTAHDDGQASDVCKFRNHGQLKEHFYSKISNGKDNNETKENNIFTDEAIKQEFIETVLTRITIIDNRIYNSLKNYNEGKVDENNKNSIFKVLGLSVFNEENKQNINADEINFLVVHLSYIEKEYKNIETFVEEEKLLNESKDWKNKKLRLVVTTGRGRDEWLDEIKDKNYRRYCMIVPLESLQTAVDNAIQLKDDFEVKYNLCKVLFGS